MKTAKIFLYIAIGCTILFTNCKDEKTNVVKTKKIVFSKEGSLSIFKAQTDSLLTQLDIEIAESEYETQTGLMYRAGMLKNQGMLFIFPDAAIHSFYMKNTQFPLDIIYIDENLRIASFQENAKPFNEEGLSSVVPVKYVLEINAGLAEEWILEVGDKIKFHKQ